MEVALAALLTAALCHTLRPARAVPQRDRVQSQALIAGRTRRDGQAGS